MVTLGLELPVEKSASVAELRKEIALALEQRLTGLVKMNLANGEVVSLIVSGGGIRQVYHRQGDVSRAASNFWLSPHLSEQQACLSIQPWPARRLVFEKILLESHAADQESRPAFKTAGLKQLFESLKGSEAGTLLQIRWQSAEAFILIPGSKLTTCPALFQSNKMVEEDAGAMRASENWQETDCDVIIHRGGAGSEAWLEAQLKILFETICNYLLTQYGYLTGRIMITSIVQNLMILASQKGWEIDRLGNAVIDQTLFASPQEAAAAYRELLAMALAHMGAVIGSILVQSILRQSQDALNTYYSNLTKTYELI